MAKVKYYYDTESLAYRIITPLKRRSFAYIMLFLLASALFGFLAFVVLLNTPFFETPKEFKQEFPELFDKVKTMINFTENI